jgi:hypothetical protein
MRRPVMRTEPRSVGWSVGWVAWGAIVGVCVITGCASAPAAEASGPPPGFRALFNGEDLTGWKGLVADPPARAKMSAEEMARAQAGADLNMTKHWRVIDDYLYFDGHGDSLCTVEEFGDFELLVDWKIPPGGDSGIYLRGSPQVQIWDVPMGSGGLYNNLQHPSGPLVRTDRAPGEWNHFDIRMVGEKVTVWLNGVLVVRDTPLENYWERDRPIYRTGQIELQSHGGPLRFRNVYIRELNGQASGTEAR